MLEVSKERLQSEMLARGMAVGALAAAAKISRGRTSELINNGGRCTYRTINYLARALGIEPTELLTFNNRKDD